MQQPNIEQIRQNCWLI